MTKTFLKKDNNTVHCHPMLLYIRGAIVFPSTTVLKFLRIIYPENDTDIAKKEKNGKSPENLLLIPQ